MQYAILKNFNIWREYNPVTDVLCVTTNMGWKQNGQNVMGAGIAKQAANEWPKLATWYGKELKRRWLESEGLTEDFAVNHSLIEAPRAITNDAIVLMFGTKPLDPVAPHLSWQQKSSLDLIVKSCESLSMAAVMTAYIDRQIWLPAPGCSNGGLSFDIVRPIVESILGSHKNVILFHRPE